MSNLTVRDVVGVGGLEGAKVIAGAGGLDRNVASISVLEVVETQAARWFVPDELYITSFYAIRENVEMQLSIVQTLAGGDCCGLVLCHVGVLLQQVPEELIRQCDRINLPLIIAKPDNSYVDILKPIMILLVDEEGGEEGGETHHSPDKPWVLSNLQNDLLELIINEKETKEIFRKINRRIHCKATYLDLYYDYIFSDKTPEEVEVEKRHIRENFGVINRCHAKKELYIWRSDHGPQVVALIKTQYSLFGFVVIDCSHVDIEQNREKLFEIIGVLCLTCPLILNRKEKMILIRDFYQEEYLADLLVWNFRSEEVAISRGLEYGLDLREKSDLIVVNVNSQQKSGHEKADEIKNQVKSIIFPSIKDLVYYHSGNGVVVYRSDTILIFLENRERRLNLVDLSNNILNLFTADDNNTASIGIADGFEGLRGIPKAYVEATNAAMLGRDLFGEGNITKYEDIWLYQKLQQFGKDASIRDMCLRRLKPLIEFDEKHQCDLLKTLSLLIAYDMDMKYVSRKLFIHRNTLLYRKNRIIEVLGYSPFTMPQMFNTMFALNVLGFNHQRPPEHGGGEENG